MMTYIGSFISTVESLESNYYIIIFFNLHTTAVFNKAAVLSFTNCPFILVHIQGHRTS